MLADAAITAMLGTMKAEASKTFYRDTLGLKLISEDQFALVFAGKNVRLRISRVPAMAAAPYAVLAFSVTDIEQTVDGLAAKGVAFTRYPFLVQDAKGIWTTPDGARVAWFPDPDLNLLSLVQGV